MRVTELTERPTGPYEITQIEQMPAIEAQAGIEIRGVSAEVEPSGSKPVRYTVRVLGELQIIAASGVTAACLVGAAVYDASGKVCCSTSIRFLGAGDKGAFAINAELECKKPPVKLKLLASIQ